MRGADYERIILEHAESGNLPNFVCDDSVGPLDAFGELLDASLLSGRKLRGDGGIVQIASPRITHTGCQRLAQLREEEYASTLAGRFRKWGPAAISFVAGVTATVLAQLLLKLLGLGK